MKRLYCLINLSWMALALEANAQTVANGWVIEDIHGPSQVGIVDTIPVDINQDGKMDVVSASIEDGHLRAYINQGNYQFEQIYISKNVPGVYRVTATDINQDGQIDFLMPSIETHEIIVLINQTDHYNKQVIASGVVLPTDAQAADFNQDGLLDVVSISFENHELLLHLQQANGTFQTEVMSFSAQRPRKLHVNDFNNDGFADILLASSGDDSVRLFSNQGNAVFAEHLISNQMTGTRFVTECNVNNDDLMDFVVSATNDDTVYVFANIGNNLFESKPVDNNLPGVNALHCADIDNDQQTELVSVASNSGNIYTHELSADLNRQLIANTRDGYVTVSVATFEQNQPLQILTQAHFENRNLLYSISTTQETVVWEDFPDGIISIQKDDSNPGGYLIAAFNSGKAYTFNGLSNTHIFNDTKGLRSLLSLDVNQDNSWDIFSVNSNYDATKIFINNGSGNFVPDIIYGPLEFPVSSQKVILDGQEKIIVVATFDNNLWVFDGSQLTSLGDSYYGSFALHVADFNNDTLDDLVIADYLGGKVKLAIQNNDGGFDVSDVSSDKPRVFDVKVIDMDDDSDLDIVSSVNQSNEVWWHENENLVFEDHLIDSEIVNPRELDVFVKGVEKYIAASSFSQDGGVVLYRTTTGRIFSKNKVASNLSGFNTVKFLNNTNGISLLVGGFNNGRFTRLNQNDLIFIDSFE